ncbi:MAG: molybdopterin-synthase adenylyltransferase MoeB [Chitinophagaceae bacterium]|nr:MAG: molybdopterin-synthase adenylyltransferase MoeB [Chitinophagaceae bacterium]
MSSLSETELSRYARHLRLSGFGESSQLKLKAAKVLVIGAGGLGSPILLYLAAAGVGTIGIVDDDYVDISNLQRQIIFDTDDTGHSKAMIAAEKLRQLNPLISVIAHNEKISSANAMQLISNYDLIADGSDNFPTRYLINDAAVLSGKPLVYGSVFRFEGQVSVFNFLNEDGSRGPNYRDLFPTPPPPDSVPDCSEAGVLGVLPGIIGSIQALEVLKILAGIGKVLSGRIFHFDALGMTSQTFTLTRRADNPLNGERPSIDRLIDYEAFCSGLNTINEITVDDFFKMKSAGERFELIDVRSSVEFDELNMGGRLVSLEDILEARNDVKDKLDKNSRLIFHCKSGSRSAKAIRHLATNFGFNKSNMFNLKGGIDGYLEYQRTRSLK